MAKKKGWGKKAISEDEVAEVMENVANADSGEALKAHSEKPMRDMSEANAEIKNHAKFDKFKKGNK